MPSLNLKSFSELVSEQVLSIQAKAARLVDFSIGSILRSLAEANAGIVMWIQQLIVKLLVTTRAATCSGEDLDSWMADFSFSRLSAMQATGRVTFSRFTATQPALIKAGAQVSTTDGTQSYTVIADTAMEAWEDGQSGYVIAAGVNALAVPVRANHAGASGNVQSGTITVIIGALPFVDTVTNPHALTNGKDAESDDDFRARFVLWIASLSKATQAAIGFALSQLQNGISYTLTENVAWDGTRQPGYFYAVVDDGSGSPTKEFLERAVRAIDAVRGFTIAFGVFAPEIVRADVTLMISTDVASDHAVVVSLVSKAIRHYIETLSLGQPLAYTQLVRAAYSASPCVMNVSALLLDGAQADVTASPKQRICPGNIQVN